MELIDSHAHIDFPQFTEDREAMLDRACTAGVTALLAIGTGPGPEKLDSALPFAEQHDWIYATVGIHPHEAKEVTPQHLEELSRLAKHPKVIAWGEIGLDYYYDHSPRDVQQKVFRDQMALAQQAKLSIIIHCRDAWSDCLNMIEEHWRPTGLGGILHCFTSTLEDARTLASVRNLSPEEVASATTGNFRRFFGLARPATLAAPGFKDKG